MELELCRRGLKANEKDITTLFYRLIPNTNMHE